MSHHEFPHLISADQVTQLLADGTPAVINIVAAWCPDCTEAQAAHLDALRNPIIESGLFFGNLLVQEEKGVFLSPLHEVIVEGMGGHGYPRSVLIANGEVISDDHVEVTERAALAELATKFISLHKQLD